MAKRTITTVTRDTGLFSFNDFGRLHRALS